MQRRAVRPVLVLLGLLLVTGLSLLSCVPNKRETHQIEIGLTNVHLTNATATASMELALSSDPFFADHKDQLNQIGDLHLRVKVSQNHSTRLRLDTYVSDPNTVVVDGATKIGDFNLLAGDVTPDTGTDVRIFNETVLRNAVLGDTFFLYLTGQADTLDVFVDEVTLIVDAKFVQ
jgi:hypothetical protein